MKLLFKAAFRNNRHWVLLVLTIISMVFLTFASQLEIFALGTVTKKGPNFFELFAPVEQGRLAAVPEVTKTQLEERWGQIDVEKSGAITREQAQDFISAHSGGDFVQKALTLLGSSFDFVGSVTGLALMFIVVALFKAVTLFIHRFSTRLVAIRVSRDLRQRYFEHIQSLPMSFYQKYNIGSLSNRVVGDALVIADAINACMINYLQTPFTVLTTLTLCFLTSWRLSLFIFLGLPLIAGPIIILAGRVKRISRQILRMQEHFASVLIDFIAGIQTVKVFAMEDFSLKKYSEHNQEMGRLEQKSAKYDLMTRPIVHTMGMGILAVVLLYGLYVLQMGISEVLVYCGLLYIFYEPIKKFAEQNSQIQRGVAAAERMYEVLNIRSKIEDSDGAETLNAFDREIAFQGVSFKYDDEWVLKDLSFKVNKGETVAIVGPTGAGKSTIVQLLPRLYDPQEGAITIDGKPLTAYTQRSIRESIAFVPQRSVLFVDTIEANISFGRSFSSEQIQAAAIKARANDFIVSMPKGYQTMLSEAGKNLSGGQQQRLTIARALVKNAPILVMDEATSSLDVVSEHAIKGAIRELHGEVTQIIIAHRLTTIEDADRIIYLEKGKKVAEGSKEELLVSCPGFRHMWERYRERDE